MIAKRSYRLNEYRITEFSDGRLWWATHSGFGTQIGGPCYVYGNILIIGSRCNEENGFLKLEFIESLKRITRWDRTRYYCSASALLDVSSGRKISEWQLQQITSVSRMTSTGSTSAGTYTPGSFRLGQNQLSISVGGNIAWKGCGGTHQIVSGPALIESDAVYLGPGKYTSSQINKKEFLHALRSLPEWDQTTLWCRSLALKPVFPDGKPSLPLSRGKTDGIIGRQQRIRIRNHRSEFAKQMWSQMNDYCADRVKGLKAKWPHRFWPKGKKKRDMGDKIY
jgi:hypothetical protein